MKNNIVSLRIAQRLKDLGFSWPTLGAYIEVYDYDTRESKECVEIRLIDCLADAKYYEEELSSLLLDDGYSEENAWTDYMDELKIEDEDDDYVDYYTPDIKDLKRNWNIDLREIFLRLLQIEFETDEEKQLYFKKFVPLEYKVSLSEEEKEKLKRDVFISWAKENIKHNYPKINDLISPFFETAEESNEDEEIIKIKSFKFVYNSWDTPTDLFYIPGLWSAPDYNMVVQWLDEVKHLHVCVNFTNSDLWHGYLFEHPESKSMAGDYNTCLENLIDSALDYLIAIS